MATKVGILQSIDWLLGHASWRMRKVEFLWNAVKHEWKYERTASWRIRLRAWRHGFFARASVLYRFDQYDRRHYVSDYQRAVRTPFINGDFAPALSNKLIFCRVLAAHSGILPRIHGMILNGRIIPEGMRDEVTNPAGFLLALLHDEGRLVLKMVKGGDGRGLLILSGEGDRIAADGQPIDEAWLRAWLAGASQYLISEFVDHHPALAALWNGTTSIMRVVTMQDEVDGPFIAGAIPKIGTSATHPITRWRVGGLCCEIDIASGRMGPACLHAGGTRPLVWCRTHPETGAEIEGMPIPHWSLVKDRLIEILRCNPYLRYVGWDIVVTREGFKILEGNSYPDLHLLQVHRPLLADQRVAAFYQRHGVLRPRKHARPQPGAADGSLGQPSKVS